MKSILVLALILLTSHCQNPEVVELGIIPSFNNDFLIHSYQNFSVAITDIGSYGYNWITNTAYTISGLGQTRLKLTFSRPLSSVLKKAKSSVHPTYQPLQLQANSFSCQATIFSS